MKKYCILAIGISCVSIVQKSFAMEDMADFSPTPLNSSASSGEELVTRSPETEKQLLDILENQLIEKDIIIAQKDKVILEQGKEIADLKAGQAATTSDNDPNKALSSAWYREHAGKLLITLGTTAAAALATHAIPGSCQDK